ncbi:MAG TPA: 2-keto-4-pentenoate hydratase [Bacteroidetes bacterium]|nr:2-keto-4-pentenoate hydratase [Bacteroidota bacterium]
MKKQAIEAAARRLREAAESGQPCSPVRDLIGETDMEAAYAVQEINRIWRLAEGARIVGSKIGLTSPSVQAQFGISQPDFGILWNDREVLNGGEISIREIMQPKAEAEIAFVLGKSLVGDGLTSVDVLSAVEYVLPAIELVGSRIKDWDIRISDTIADNASASHWVVGHRPVKLGQLDLINCNMVMKKNDTIASSGKGAACLGSPVNAVLWLARTMERMGQPLQAGDIVLSGALGPMVNVKEGDHFHAWISGLGEVSVRFTE